MSDVNPYQPPQTDPSVRVEQPRIDVDGNRLVVASGTQLPRRCIKTNQPVTEKDLIRQILQWRGRFLQVVLTSKNCELEWFVASRIRWRTRFAMVLSWSAIIGGFLMFGAVIDSNPPSSLGPAISMLLFITGLVSSIVIQVRFGLRVVDYQDGRFWIEGCCPEFLKSLRKDLEGR